ncbi:MAG: PspA/IM30 family protein, partial [Thermoanaerobaculia bacterium]
LLQKMQGGDLDPAQAESLATQALGKKEEAAQRAVALDTDYQAQDQAAQQLKAKVDKLRRDVSRYENELVTLRARARTAESMKKINKQLAGVDSSSTLAMLEKMKARVEENESLAAAYGELTDGSASVDDEIATALAEPADAKASDSLAALKAKMGIES